MFVSSTLLAYALAAVLAYPVLTMLFGLFQKRWSPKGLHCYVTGGSTGLGLSLSILLTKAGAHVSIVARDETKLRDALEALEAARVNPGQILKSYSFSLADAKTAARALDTACEPHGGKAPDAVFTCAGSSKPGFWIEQEEDDLLNGMTNSYWIQAWTALAATRKMVQSGVQGKIVFVSSILGYIAVPGYATYSPGKHALRGLADTLNSELALYNIQTHIFFPPTMYTPGYETENKTKPALTLKIEEDDKGLSPETAAKGLLRGVERGQVHISADILTSLFRASTRGAAPYHNPIVDAILGAVAFIAVPVWRWSVAGIVRKHQAEHATYLTECSVSHVLGPQKK